MTYIASIAQHKQTDCKTKVVPKLEKMKKTNATINSNIAIKGLRIMLCIVMVWGGILRSNAQQILPRNYWTFEGTTPMKDSMNNSPLNPAYYGSTYTILNGAVGKGISLGSGGKTIVASGVVNVDSLLTIEFLFKPAGDFSTSTFLTRRDGAMLIKMGYPYIQFITNILSPSGTTINDNLNVSLEAIGRASYSYYVDGNYHHFVFKYNTKTGEKSIWIDGQNPSGFSSTTATGRFNLNTSTPNNNIIDLNTNTSYYRLNGTLDEVALYNIELPDGSIYKHYQDFKAGAHYSFANVTTTPPVAAPVSAGVDLNEYAPGHPNYTVSASDQLQSFPTPRYKKGHTLLANFNWLGMDYFAGYFQPNVSYAQAVTNSVTMQRELAKNFNYSILVSSNTSNSSQYTNTTKFHGAWVQLANQNPQWPTGAISFWAQLNPQNAGFASNIGYIENKNLPANHYLKNASGQFLALNGSASTTKYWSPAAPIDSFMKDGLTQKYYMQQLLTSLNRPLNFICENGEVIPKPSTTAMQNDPLVTADKNASGLDWETYLGNRKKLVAKGYRDQFFTLSGLANTKYAEYQIAGSLYSHKYSETRLIQKTINGMQYATPDFYPRWPSNWLTGVSAWHGWKQMIEGRYYELGQNDKLYSPFIAAGWNEDQERNICPAQWLGLLKAMNMTGAEFFYTGFFNEASSYTPPNPAPANPAGYAWQAVVPSYAQATLSRYEDILRNGSLLPGDVPYNPVTPTQPGYSFNAGDSRKLVVIRKHDTQNKYAITGSIQPNSNMMGNAELEGDANIMLNGQPLQFKIRRQGSTYVYDATNASAPIFYQVDGWHEATHPFRWSKDFNIESELYDNISTISQMKTERPSNAAAGDFRNFTTYITHPNTATTFSTFEYNFTPRIANSTYYVWVRARSRNGSPAGLSVSLSGQFQKSIGCITDTAWNWYSIDACSAQAIRFQSLNTQEYSLFISPNSAFLEIDRMLLTLDPAINLNANQSACGTSVASVTNSGPTVFCQGGNVTLTAATGASYAWSTGATTQSITVSASGNYTVSVGTGTGCASISNPVPVIVMSRPVPTITPSGPTAFCSGQNVILTAPTSNAYAWSNGATTQSITVTTSGNYNVTVTNTSGCTGSATAVAINVTAQPVATITPSGATTFCQGGSVILSASTGSSYLWSNGATTQTINVNSAGSFVVTVSNGTSCSAVSAAQNVTVSNNAVATITSSGNTNFCQGGSVTLTAGTGSTYQWSNGATSQSITVANAGNYVVTVGNGTGCNATSTPVAVIVNTNPPAAINTSGSTNFCSGQTVTLTSSTGANYLWSNGATTQSVTVSASGNYQVTVTNTSGCSSISPTKSVTVFPTPVATITAGGNTTFCQGGSVLLSAPTGYNYNWSNGSTAQSITVNNSGSFSVTVTNSNGCSAVSGSTPVSVNQIPVAAINANGATGFCPGGSVTIVASGGANYLWSNGATTNSITVSQNGTYSAVVSNPGGCSATTSAISIIAFPTPVALSAASGSTNLNPGEYVVLAASVANSYVWQPGGETTSSIVVTSSGTYSATLTDANGCTGTTAPIVVSQVVITPTVTIQSNGPTTFCEGGSVLLSANGAGNYLWAPGGATTASITATTSGIYYLYSRNASGQVVSTDSMTVKVNQKPLKPWISITYIPNTAYQLTAFAPSATSYQWSNGQSNSTITVTQPQILTVTASDNFGCKSDVGSMTVVSIQAQSCTNPNMLTAYNISDTSAILGWNPGITGEVYVIKFWEIGSTTISERRMAGNFSNVFINNLNPGTEYNWNAEIICTSGSNVSATGSFKTLGGALSCGSIPQYTRAVNINTTKAELKWYATTADTYLVKYRPLGATSYKFRLFTGAQYLSGGKVTNLLPATPYEWQVRTTCGGYTSSYSQPDYFTTIDTCGYLGTLSVITVTPSTATVQWSNTSNMDTIRVRITDTTNGIQRTIYVAGNPANGTFLVRNLKPNRTYTAEAKGRCSSGALGTWTQAVSFTTLGINARENDVDPLSLTGYPNPASDLLFFSFTSDENSDYVVKVSDLSGRELMQQVRYAEDGENVGEIPVSTYAKGIYLLIVQKGTVTSRFRFSVQ